MNKFVLLIGIGIAAVLKLLITGICLAIGFKIGGIITAEAEKRIAKKTIRFNNINVEPVVA